MDNKNSLNPVFVLRDQFNFKKGEGGNEEIKVWNFLENVQ
jgi:hypothetical protein